MNKIITIGREFDSGGRELARRLSEELNIPYYDQEIVAAVASRTKLSEEYVQRIRDHRPMMSFPIHIGRSFYPTVPVLTQHTNAIFLEESKFLKEMASSPAASLSGAVPMSSCGNTSRCVFSYTRTWRAGWAGAGPKRPSTKK